MSFNDRNNEEARLRRRDVRNTPHFAHGVEKNYHKIYYKDVGLISHRNCSRCGGTDVIGNVGCIKQKEAGSEN